jgi:hypothetical protein
MEGTQHSHPRSDGVQEKLRVSLTRISLIYESQLVICVNNMCS